MSLQARSPLREETAHLLRRFGLGASEAELDYYLADGTYEGAVQRLLNPDAVPEAYEVPVESFFSGKGVLKPGSVTAWWTFRLLSTRRPLAERMTLFWHNHFATGGDKVKAGMMLHAQNQTLRANALGSFRELLGAVAKDPAMLLYLDNQENVAGKPNENFAREVMELFTLGIDGGYTEKDIQEAARAFTGWAYMRGPVGENGDRTAPVFTIRPRLHDNGEKTIFGRTGPFGGDDVLDMLCANPRTAEFLVTKIWKWHVEPNPSPATIAPFARSFYASNLNIGQLLRDIMLSPRFRSPAVRRAIVKNPMDMCVVTLRQLGKGEAMAAAAAGGATVGAVKATRARAGLAALTANAMRTQGLWLLYPPDVSGWKPGEAWVTSATMVERISWANKLFGQAEKGNVGGGLSAYAFLAQDQTPEAVVDRFASIFDATLTPEKRAVLVKTAAAAMGSEGMRPTTANKVAAAVCRPLFGLPEFQLA